MKTGTKPLSIKGVFLILAFIASASSCTKYDNSDLTNSQERTFAGVESVTAVGDGKYTVSWSAMPVSGGTYHVYARSAAVTAMNFSSSLADVVDVGSWTSGSLLFSGKTCFSVRFSKDGLKADTNTKEVCTDNQAYTFPGLASAAIDDFGDVTLSWEAVATADVSYKIYRREKDKEFDWNQTYQVTTNNSYKVTAYAVDKEYCFAVRYSVSGAPDDSNTTEICPDLPVIKGFNGIKAVTSTLTGVADLTWDAPTTGADSVAAFQIYADASFKTMVNSTITGSTGISLANLLADHHYIFGVRIVDKYGRTESNTKTAEIDIINNLAPTFGGLKTADITGTGCVTLGWNAADGHIKAYNIYWAKGTTGSTPTVTDLLTPLASTTELSKQICNLGDDLAHSFVVRAQSSGGQEDSNTTTLTKSLPDNGAPIFSGIKTATFSAGKATVTWDAALGELANYKVYYNVGTSINWGTATVVNVASNVLTYDLTGLQDSQDYTFAVRAVDSHTAMDSNTQTLTRFSGDVTPPLFQNYNTVTATSETQIHVVVNKSNEADVSHYSIQARIHGSGADFVEKQTVTQPSSGATVAGDISGLLAGTSYDVLVKVFDTNGNESTNSTSYQVTTLDQTAPQFFGVKTTSALSGTPSTAVVTWDAGSDPSGIKEYRVYYSTSAINGVTLNTGLFSGGSPQTISGKTIYMTSPLSGVTTNIASLSSQTTYYFMVHAIDNQNNEDSNTAQSSYTVPDLTQPSTPASLAFSPDPGGVATSLRTFAVTGTATQGNTVRVYNGSTELGSQLLSTGTSFNITVTLPNTTGNYVVTVKQENPSGVQSATGNVGTYILDVDAPTITLVSGISPTTVGSATSSVNSANFTFKCSETCSYTVKDGTTSVASGNVAGNTNSTVTVNSSALASGDGSHTLTLTVKDAALNSTSQNMTLTLDTQAPLNVTNLVAVRNEQSGNYELTWSNNALDSTDVIHIRLATGTTTPPTASGGSSFASSLAYTTTSKTGAYGSETKAAFTVQACDSVGNCADVSSCASCKASLETNTYYNLSEGDTIAASYVSGTIASGSVTPRLGQSSVYNDAAAWNGVASSIPNGSVVTSFTSNAASVSFTNGVSDPEWSKRYFRLAVSNNLSGGIGVYLTKVRYWAKVPTGMVFVSKSEWPSGTRSEFSPSLNESYTTQQKFDFAIDKYEASISGKGSGAQTALASQTAYPNALASFLISDSTVSADYGDYYAFKQGCLNRSYDSGYSSFANVSDLVSGDKATVKTPNPLRKFHLAGTKEWSIAAYGTPDQGGASYCNYTSGNGVLAANLTGGSSTQYCMSYFGARNMFGNINEYVDALVMNGVRGAIVARPGTTSEQALQRANALSLNTTTGIRTTSVGWDFSTQLPVDGSSTNSESSFRTPYQLTSTTQTWAVLRGGYYLDNTTNYAGRFETQMASAPETSNQAGFGGRCAILAPQAQATINYFEMDSDNSGSAKMYWNVDNTETNTVIRLGYSTTLTDINAWDGSTSAPTNGNIVTNFSSCSTYTPATELYTGKYCETPGVARYYRLCVENFDANNASLGSPTCSTARYFGNATEKPTMADVILNGRNIKLQNDSNGKWAIFYSGLIGANSNSIARIAYSPYKDEIDRWQGETKTFTAGGMISGSAATLAATCSSASYSGPSGLVSGTDYSYYFCLDMSTYPKWTKMFFKAAFLNGDASSTPRAVTLSETEAHGYVPDGMVFVPRELWPSSQYGALSYCTGATSSYNVSLDQGGPHTLNNCSYDFAIDKYENYTVSGSADTTAFTSATDASNNTTTAITASVKAQTPSTFSGNSWGMIKACLNRTSGNVAAVSGFTGSSVPTKVRLPTGVEFVASMFDTPDEGSGQANLYCAVNTSLGQSGALPKCISQFGAYDGIGNYLEPTWDVSADYDTTSKTGIWHRFYGTSADFALNSGSALTYPGAGFATAFNYILSYITSTTATSGPSRLSYYGSNGTPFVTYRGGYNATGAGGSVTAIAVDNIVSSSNSANVAPRCALAAP